MTVILIILDGWGLREEREANAVKLGNVPTFNHLWESGLYSTTTLGASGEAVGLPKGQIGGSEVGHLNLGAGTVIYTELTFIDRQIETGEFFRSPALLEAMTRAAGRESSGNTLHLMGLVSDGGIHSYNTHIYALIEMAKRNGVTRLALHAFTDGRDTPPQSGLGYIRELQAKLDSFGIGQIATVIGRYYAMDRDKRWERTQLAYRAMVEGVAERTAQSAAEAVEDAYRRGETDEFIFPYVITDANGAPRATIKGGDTIIGFNFRGDRMRQLYSALMDENFHGFVRQKLPDLHFVTMGVWGDDVTAPRAFVRPPQATCLAEVLSKHGKRQYHTAETEKFRHVTFFFNGQRDEPFEGEDRYLEPSPKDVPTYDLKPEMSAIPLTDKAVEAILSRQYDFILLNYANPDMVGHTGVLEAAIKAVETVDSQLARLLDAAKQVGATVIVTADHGNCELMVDPETGQPHTAHTMNRVPFILITPDGSKPPLREGNLCNVAPTILQLMGIPKPSEMDAESLLA
ncbi:MAG: 2,3-bisphosphoglycerate-independent phosphoglycerate mutase [Candidatus Thermofonsia Clade 1 bacterium]|uniref:2,3-bisphosphoglycerate-independent phosphoglycerate mutase n=1 Tax=Candidatus Thermofonsia Clade 1 bacterium TaxID=2364210 RepID=A0A2M8P2E2_9CHLR|nr:MAG: 2,3-bisphosphoglycerate-independent phosphoglycerate mutase [Candidatus Thermofonsia Clade 1 bacterium]